MRAAVVHIYSVDIMAIVLLLSQPRTSTENVRLAIPRALLSVGNVAERLIERVVGPDLWKESPGFLGRMPALLSPPPSTCISPCGFPFRAAANLLAGFPITL